MLAFVVLQACSSTLDVPASPTPVRPAPAAPRGLRPAATFTVPPSVRPGGEPAPERIPLVGAFAHDEQLKRVDLWKVPLPVGADLLPTATKGTHTFGSHPPPGLVLRGPSGAVPFEFRGRRSGTYGFDPEWLYVGLSAGSAAPEAGKYFLEFPRATAAEAAMNLATSGLAVEDFVPRTVTVGGVSHAGWFLPAPASATFEVAVPDAGLLAFAPGLVPPAVLTGAASDGAGVRVVVTGPDGEVDLGERPIRPGWRPERFDLARWAGQRVTVRVETTPGATPDLDYVLLEDPVVYAPQAHPRKVVLLFVDTLRADHVGFLGYTARPTTPHFDRWASNAAVFANARTIAPWTLPSARAALTGRQPEQWDVAETLAERFAAAGWRTDAQVANAFLSQPFGLERGWARFGYTHLQPPDAAAAEAVARLADWPDRDQVVLVHVMGPHLPYDEPWYYRYPWAGMKPTGVQGVGRPALMRVTVADENFEALRDYVTARYDANVRWTDDQLSAVLEAAGPDATAVLFSDHGEELWDHEGFEHGHAFWDELLRVPFAVKSPGLVPGTYDTPVSLLDLAPTVLALEGLPAGVAAGGGTSLVGLTFGDALPERPVGFGRPLYGEDGWGVVDGGKKWVARGLVQTLHDLAADPGETRDLATDAEVAGWGERLEAAVGRPVRRVWRVTLPAGPWPHERTLTLTHPLGLQAVWTAFDPRGRTAGVRAEVRDGVATVVLPAEGVVPDAIYALPVGDALDPRGLVATLVGRQVKVTGAASDQTLAPRAVGRAFLVADDPKNAVRVDLAVVPEPDGAESASAHPELDAQLRDLGYLDGG